MKDLCSICGAKEVPTWDDLIFWWGKNREHNRAKINLKSQLDLQSAIIQDQLQAANHHKVKNIPNTRLNTTNMPNSSDDNIKSLHRDEIYQFSVQLIHYSVVVVNALDGKLANSTSLHCGRYGYGFQNSETIFLAWLHDCHDFTSNLLICNTKGFLRKWFRLHFSVGIITCYNSNWTREV